MYFKKIKITKQVEASDCAFAVLATLLQYYCKESLKFDHIKMRTVLGEGKDGISFSGFVRLLTKTGFKFKVLKGVANQLTNGIFVFLKIKSTTSHITLVTKNNKSIREADLVNGSWNKYNDKGKYYFIQIESHKNIYDFSNFVLIKNKNHQLINYRKILFSFCLNLFLKAIPFVSLALLNFFHTNNGALYILFFLLSMFTSLILEHITLKFMKKNVQDQITLFIEKIFKLAIDFFEQRSLSELINHMRNSESFSLLIYQYLPRIVVNTSLIIILQFCILITTRDLSLQLVLILFIVFDLTFYLLITKFKSKNEEKEKQSSGIFELNLFNALENPLGVRYSKINILNNKEFIASLQNSLKYKYKGKGYETTNQSVIFLINYLVTFGVFYFYTAVSIINLLFIIGLTRFVTELVMDFGNVIKYRNDSSGHYYLMNTSEKIHKDSISIPEEKLIFINGKNGSGKTSYLKSICPFFEDKDYIQRKISSNNNLKLYSNNEIVYINRFFRPYGRTINDAILSFIDKDLLEDAYALLDEFLEFKNRDIKNIQLSGTNVNLSDGELQILSIFFITLINPKIILIDEGFNSIQPKERSRILEKLLRNIQDESKIIIVEHDKIDVSEINTSIREWEFDGNSEK